MLAKENVEFLPNAGKDVPAGTMAVVSSTDFVGDRDCNIEPPTSPYAIMRRVHPYRGENNGPGKDDRWRA